MDRVVGHEEIADMLGAFALDAVDGDEAAAIAQHLLTCPRCTAELAEHRSAASLLANQGGDAPGALWDRISAQLQPPAGAIGDMPVPRLLPAAAPGHVGTVGAAQAGHGNLETTGVRGAGVRRSGAADGVGDTDPARSLAGQRRGGRRWRTSAAGAIAAAAAVVIALLAVQVGRLDSRVGSLNALASHQNMPALAEQALADPQAQHVALVDASIPGHTLGDLVILPSGTAYLVESTLPALPSGQTYQLWGIMSGQAVSLGLLGRHPGVEAFTLDPDAPLTQFAVTAEPAGGVVISNHAPVAEGTVRSD